jgi:hypothetical protein
MWIRTGLLALALAMISASNARAEPRSLERDFGVGLAIGVASGPNLQFKPTDYDGHITVGFGIGSVHSMRFQADYAWRVAYFARGSSAVIPFYIGAGAFFTDREWGRTVGARVPIGVQAEMVDVPVQIFGELSPEIIAYDHVSPDVMAPGHDRITLRALLGVRASF